MHIIIKSDKIRWLKNVIKIPKQFYKLKSDLRFMIYGIQVCTQIRESRKSWTVGRILIFKTVLESLQHFYAILFYHFLSLLLFFLCKNVFVKTDHSRGFFKLGIFFLLQMAFIYPPNNPGGDHLTISYSTHVSPPGNCMH